jgi:protein arginine N-methyltransferase 2
MVTQELLNKEYLENDITYTNDGRLLDYKGNSIMMEWEDDIMKDAAALICKDGGKILNIGFGLGLIDNYIQSYNPEEHWIIEAHPQVFNKMKSEGWDKKSNVTCILDKWQNVIQDLPKFDGIFFDTWREYSALFHKNISNLLNPGGKILLFSTPLPDGKSYWEMMGFEMEEYITKLKNINPNQKSDGTFYWDPNRKEYTHQLIINK